MKGAETQADLVIGAPLSPSSVIWTPGIFSAGIVPVMQVTATSDTSFEFWYSGETRITDVSNVEEQSQFLGRASQWNLHGLKADTPYYMYVRTRNAFGVSAFVEAFGQASADIPGLNDYVDNAIRDSGAFGNLQGGVDSNLEAAIQNALANNATAEHQWVQYGEVRAEVLIVTTTIADVKGAMSELSTTVQAQIGSLTATVNEKMTASVTSDGDASAFYDLGLQIVRDDVPYKTGMSMGIEPDGAGSYKSTVVFAADQFGIYSGSEPSNYQYAFSVINGQVFISDAFIRDASITSAKIDDAAITNAKISGSLWSTGYKVANQGGWCLSKKDNNLSFTGPSGRLLVQLGHITGVAPDV